MSITNKFFNIFTDKESQKKQEIIEILNKYENKGLEKTYSIHTLNTNGTKKQIGWKMPKIKREGNYSPSQ